ncbi:MAG TPA: hypothetical protein VED20_15235 [Streptosporangiaceae bacterium]|nr:hypothetical protein [Streptosporangiaceae bacterium]
MIDINDLLDAMADPAAVDEHWRQICKEMVGQTAASEYERGLHEGYLLAVADLKAFQHGAVRDAQLEQRRWHLCCRRCQLEGHRDGCQDCEERTRETFGQAFSGEVAPAEITARALASWEPYGLPPAGMVHLGGAVVHHHRCAAPCHAYRSGYYTPAEAIAIIETLPGDYAEVLAGLRARAGSAPSGRTAA